MNNVPVLSAAATADLAKSMISCGLAVSILVAKNVLSVTAASGKPPVKQSAESFERITSTVMEVRSTSAAPPNATTGTGVVKSEREISADFYRVGEAAQQEFATNPLLFGGFQAGDQAQRALIDFAVDALTLRVLRPDYLPRAAEDMVRRSVEAAGSFDTADERRLAVEQYRNIFGVIGLVNDALPASHRPPEDYPLESRVYRAYEKGKYPALWAVEGLGQDYAENFLRAGKPVRGLLTTGKGAKLPEQSLLMMHAGAGLAFAKHVIVKITPYSTDAEIDCVLREFFELVKENAREGYSGPLLESLGLVTRTWYGPLVEPVSRRLAAIDPIAAQYFWHGAGRAMYFSPVTMLPGFSPWEVAGKEPPDETARLNARAGVAWAFTVVNLRQPEIIANLLASRAAQMAENRAFADGVTSTLIMASEMVPDNTNVTRFCRYQPDPSKPGYVEAWDRNIGRDCETRLETYRRTLRASGRLGEVFRYQSLAELVASLDPCGERAVTG